MFSLFYYSGTYSYSRLGVEQVFCFLNLSHTSYPAYPAGTNKKTYTFKNEDKSARLDNIGFVFSLGCYQILNYSFHFRNMSPLNLSFQSIIFLSQTKMHLPFASCIRILLRKFNFWSFFMIIFQHKDCSFGANSSILVVVSYLFLYIKFNLTLMKIFFFGKQRRHWSYYCFVIQQGNTPLLIYWNDEKRNIFKHAFIFYWGLTIMWKYMPCIAINSKLLF